MRNNARLVRSPLSPQDPNIYHPNRKYKSCVSLTSKNVRNFPSNQFAQKPNDEQNITNSTILYLDLSNNKINSDSLQTLGQNLISLNLSNNPLKTCKLPSLPRLRSLNLDNCCISSFHGMPFFPSLKKLSLYGNPILNFSGCPMMPKLESINILKFPPKMIIAAFGSVNLYMINKKKLLEEQIKSAFIMSPIVGIALRNGREVIELDTPEDEMKASIAFLTVSLREYLEKNNITSEPKLTIEQSEGENYVLHCPFEAKSYKWFRHTYPDKGNEWKPIKFDGRDLPITMAIRLHMIKCQIQMVGSGNKTFSLYNEEPIGKGKIDYSLPYPVFPLMTGTAIEGSMIAVLPMPVQSKIVWTKGSETIAKDTKSIIIPRDAVGSAIACVMQPYHTKFPEVIFSPIFTTSEIVSGLLPSVAGIQFPEVIIECEPFTFERIMLPEDEGESEIFVERALTPSSEWVLCKQISPTKLRYNPKSGDINHFLRIAYTPITKDGTKGHTTYFYSQTKVIPTAPTFFNPMIGGVAKTNYPLIALADYAGGKKGKCSYDWYFSKRPIDTTRGPSKRLLKVAHNTQFFTPPPNMAEGYIAVMMVPVRDDDIIGDPVFVSIDNPIQIDDPPKPLPNAPSEVIVGKKIEFSKPVDFLLSKTTGYFGFDFLKTSKRYTPRVKHIGRILRVVTPGTDMVLGEIKPAIPKVLSVKIECDRWQAGSTAQIAITHKNLDPDKLEILWLRTNGAFQKAIAIDVPVYVITNEDVGYSLLAVVTVFNEDREKMDPIYSNLSPIIHSEEKINLKIVGTMMEGKEISVTANKEIQSVTWYQHTGKKESEEIGHESMYLLTIDDIGKYIKAKVVLENGMVLSTTTKECVTPCKPTAKVVLPTQVSEGDLITPQITYTGGTEGKSIMRWYRETYEGWEFIKESLSYQVTIEDIDSLLKFVYIPIRQDNKRGQEIEVECGPVDAKMPTVTNVKIFQNNKGYIEVTGDYIGGVEGQSMIVWRVYDDNGDPTNIGKTIEKEMMPSEEFVNKIVEAGYVPIRKDGIGGQPVMSNKITVEPLPEVQSAEILVKKGKVIAENPMRCNATVPSGCTALYQWYFGDGQNWQEIPEATNVQFTPTNEEVGFYILCSIIAVNKRGWKSLPYAAVTSRTVLPSVTSLKICSSSPTITTGMILTTNVDMAELSKMEIKWQRESKSKWKDIIIDDEYVVSVNDVGYRLRAVDSTGRISEPTNVIDYDPQVASYINALLKTQNMKFIGNPKFGHTVWYAAVSSFGVSLENGDKKKKQSKWSLVKVEAVLGTIDEMMLWMDPSSKFHFIPSLSHDPRLESLVKKENVRDFVVAVILGIKKLHQK